MTAARRYGLALVVLASSLVGCGPRHVEPFTPRTRVYKPGEYAQTAVSARPAPGSLFSEAHGGWLQDTRAVRVGDLVVIKIDESANATGNASTSLKRDGEGSSGVSSALGLVPALKRAYPDLDTTKLVEFATKNGFTGEGDTSRKGTLNGSIAVRIAREMPNGDMFLEGTKVVLINNEEYHLYVSGLVRPTDINPDNSVASTRIADAQIEFTGRGDMADQQRKGWFARMLDSMNPF
ncbi:MAG: flagellar basal body L-ring protein FlgH [Deltaproteobacteria bacterium]|nr:flagellar basal body L-ring protein FlgH [Deltaproteobacteria bacterium]